MVIRPAMQWRGINSPGFQPGVGISKVCLTRRFNAGIRTQQKYRVLTRNKYKEMETTVDINALRNELAREILETDDLGLLEWIRKKMDSHESLRPYTAEELRARVRRAEAEDPEGTDWDDFEKELKQELPWLRV